MFDIINELFDYDDMIILNHIALEKSLSDVQTQLIFNMAATMKMSNEIYKRQEKLYLKLKKIKSKEWEEIQKIMPFDVYSPEDMEFENEEFNQSDVVEWTTEDINEFKAIIDSMEKGA